MGFISSLINVNKNSKKFKEWEKEDKNKQEQRKALSAKQYLDKETLEKAKAKGKVIIDIVDIMDTHSEDVAENVEETVVPIVHTIPMIGSFGTGALIAQFGIKPALTKYEEVHSKVSNVNNPALNSIKDEILEAKKTADISSDIGKLKLENYSSPAELFTNKKNKKIFENATDTKLQEYWGTIKKHSDEYWNNPAIKNFGKKMKACGGLFAGISLALFVASHVIGAKLQVRSSRIARWQSRRDLNDPKYFVQYTPEQIAQAEENLKKEEANNENNKKSLFPFKGLLLKGKEKDEKGFFATMGSIIKDNKHYTEWKDNYNLEDKKVKRELTQEELVEAQKEQEVIQRVTKQINNNAEDYSENMEVAAGVLIGGTPFLGAGVGFVMDKLFKITGLKETLKNSNKEKFIESFSGADAQKAAKDALEGCFKQVAKNGKTVEKIELKGIENLCDVVVKSVDKKAGKAGAFKTVKKVIQAAMSTNKGIGLALGVITTIATSVAGAVIGLKLQKSAARAGRFKAKQEIQQDPNNFIGYTKDEFQTVSDVKAKKEPLLKRFGKYIMFVPNCIKDYIEYEKHKKNVKNKDKALMNELIKLDVSDEQLKEAKELQRKVFTTFESVDDKSQEYSESMETMNEIVQPVLPYLGVIATAAPIAVAGFLSFRKGPANFVDKVTAFFAKHTRFLKGKFVKNYSDNVAQNINKFFGNTSGESAELLQGVSLSKVCKEAFGIGSVSDLQEIAKSGEWKNICAGLSKNSDIPPKMRRMLDNLAKSNMTNEQASNIIGNAAKIIDNIPVDQINKIVSVISKAKQNNPDKFCELMQSGDFTKLFKTKDLTKLLGIVGGSWSALSLILTFALETTFASMQKKAGRLGVMEGLNELSAPEYYANMEPDNSSNNSSDISSKGNIKMQNVQSMSPALQRLIKK